MERRSLLPKLQPVPSGVRVKSIDSSSSSRSGEWEKFACIQVKAAIALLESSAVKSWSKPLSAISGKHPAPLQSVGMDISIDWTQRKKTPSHPQRNPLNWTSPLTASKSIYQSGSRPFVLGLSKFGEILYLAPKARSTHPDARTIATGTTLETWILGELKFGLRNLPEILLSYLPGGRGSLVIYTE